MIASPVLPTISSHRCPWTESPTTSMPGLIFLTVRSISTSGSPPRISAVVPGFHFSMVLRTSSSAEAATWNSSVDVEGSSWTRSVEGSSGHPCLQGVF